MKRKIQVNGKLWVCFGKYWGSKFQVMECSPILFKIDFGTKNSCYLKKKLSHIMRYQIKDKGRHELSIHAIHVGLGPVGLVPVKEKGLTI